MTTILKAFLDEPALQAAVVGLVVWAILRGLKAAGVLIYEGEDRYNRIKAAVASALVGLAGSAVAHWSTGAPVDWAKLAVAVVLAWIGATGIHTLTRPTKPA